MAAAPNPPGAPSPVGAAPSSSDDPLGLIKAATDALGALEGMGEVFIGAVILAAALVVIVAQTPAGRQAIRGAGTAGKTALKVIPQTRAVALALG